MKVNQLFTQYPYSGIYRCIKTDSVNNFVYGVLIKPYGNSWIHHLQQDFVIAPKIERFKNDPVVIAPVAEEADIDKARHQLVHLHGIVEDVSFLLDTDFEDLLSNEKNEGWDIFNQLNFIPFVWICKNPEQYPKQLAFWENEIIRQSYIRHKFELVTTALSKD